MKKKDVGRPRLGKQIKSLCAFRIENRHKKLIKKNHGTIQKWVDKNVSMEVEKCKKQD